MGNQAKYILSDRGSSVQENVNEYINKNIHSLPVENEEKYILSGQNIHENAFEYMYIAIHSLSGKIYNSQIISQIFFL